MATDTTKSTSDQSSSTIGATSSSTSKTGATSEVASKAASSTDISARITEWRLSESEIQADLDRGAAIVRTKDSVVGAPTGNTDDSVVQTMVKGKLQADSETGKAMIDVKAKNGEVTLDGSADSAGMVGRAIALALDTQGVSKVTANVKVNAKSID